MGCFKETLTDADNFVIDYNQNINLSTKVHQHLVIFSIVFVISIISLLSSFPYSSVSTLLSTSIQNHNLSKRFSSSQRPSSSTCKLTILHFPHKSTIFTHPGCTLRWTTSQNHTWREQWEVLQSHKTQIFNILPFEPKPLKNLSKLKLITVNQPHHHLHLVAHCYLKKSRGMILIAVNQHLQFCCAVYLFLSHIFGWNSFDLTLQGMPFIFVNWNYCICCASAQDFSFLFWVEIFTHQPLWGDSFYICPQNPILYISACDPNVLFFRQHWNK